MSTIEELERCAQVVREILDAGARAMKPLQERLRRLNTAIADAQQEPSQQEPAEYSPRSDYEARCVRLQRDRWPAPFGCEAKDFKTLPEV